MSDLKTQVAPIAQRITNAENWWRELLWDLHKLNADQADHVAAVFVAHKLIKMDIHHGRYTLKDGRVLDQPVVIRALAENL